MRVLAVLLAALVAISCRANLAETSPRSATTSLDYRDEPVVFEHYDATYRFKAEGTGTQDLHVAVRVQSEGAVRQYGVLSFSYASSVETLSIVSVRVHKPDGSTADTPVGDAMEMPAPVTREAPLFSDLKEKQIPVRNLAVGDTLEYIVHSVRTAPEAPNQFWGSTHFTSTGVVVLSETFTLEAPATTYVQVWSPHHPASPETANGLRTWHWNSSQLLPSGRDKDGNPTGAAAAKDPDTDSDGRSLPSVGWTTFRSWAEVGGWYRSLALSRAQPTPDITREAAELTAGLGTTEAQVQALYSFVSTHIRYVGVDLGIGRYQPHTASDVLSARYGDCKDKDTLLEALLRARGFKASPALIGVNLAPVPDLPSPALFNHVITTVDLPSGRLWMDATPEVNSFRVLSLPLRDEQVLLIPAMGDPRLDRTPADSPFPFTESFDAAANLDAAGVLKGHIVWTTRSDSEPGLRMLVQRAAPAQWDDAVQYLSNALGFSGKVSHADLHQVDPAAPVHLAYDYTRPDFADWANNRILPLFPVLEIPVIEKEKAPEHDIDQGAPRTLVATTRITLPHGYRPDLPEPVHVKRPYATLDQTYSFSKGDLVVERTVHILERKIPKANWKDYSAYLKSTGVETGETYISLIPPAESEKMAGAKDRAAKDGVAKGDTESPSVATPHGAPTTNDATAPASASTAGAKPNASAADLIEQARQAEARKDWLSAHALLERAHTLDAHARYLQSMLGFIALRNHKPEEGITLLHDELHDYPDDDISIVEILANALLQNHRPDEAISLLTQDLHHDDPRLILLLSASQWAAGDTDAAISTLQHAAAAHPDNHRLPSALAGALFEAHRDTEAAAVATTVLDGSDDPIVMNSNAYILAETNTSLPLAESSARRAVLSLETASLNHDLASANSLAFQQTEQLAATWDTLGFVLLREGKLADSAPFLAAAWFNHPGVAVGDHLGLLFEAQGKPADALALYRVAQGAEDADSRSRDLAALKSSVARLEAAGVHPSTGVASRSLQDMRTFRIARPADLKGWGTLRLQLSTSGISDSTLVTGPSTFEPIRPELASLKLPDAVPTGSRAHILRDAVVSCSSGQPTCELVLMPHSNLSTEGIQ